MISNLQGQIVNQSSLCRLACEATKRELHLVLSAAVLGDVLSDRPLLLRSFSMVRLHVF